MGGAGRQADAAQGQGAGARGRLTSGKVPLEKTLQRRCQQLRGRTKGLSLALAIGVRVHLHEQTGLSAGAVTDNHELATDLGHFVCVGSVGLGAGGWCGGAGRAGS